MVLRRPDEELYGSAATRRVTPENNKKTQSMTTNTRRDTNHCDTRLPRGRPEAERQPMNGRLVASEEEEEPLCDLHASSGSLALPSTRQFIEKHKRLEDETGNNLLVIRRKFLANEMRTTIYSSRDLLGLAVLISFFPVKLNLQTSKNKTFKCL